MKSPWLYLMDRGGLGFENFCIGFGLLLSGGAGWPVYYAFRRGGGRVDISALSAGIIGITVGVSILMWGVRSRRKPRSGVWLDLRGRQIIVAEGARRRAVAFEALGEVVVEYRRFMVRSQQISRWVVMYSVQAPSAFGETKLFDHEEQAESEVWAERLRALTSVEHDIESLQYDEAELRAAVKAFGAPRETVLWRAAAFAKDGHVDAEAFERARVDFAQVRGSVLGRAVASSLVGAVLLTVALGVGGKILLGAFEMGRGPYGEMVISGTVCVFFAVLWLRAIGLWPLAVGASAIAGAALALKPVLRPVMAGEGRPFGLTSETHLYFLVPGLLLLATGLWMAFHAVKDHLARRAEG